MARILRATAFVALVIMAVVVRPIDAGAATVSGPDVGVQFHATWSDYTDEQRLAVLDKMAAAGLTWVRIDLGWASFQETSRTSYSSWYVRRADFVIDAARARGLKVLATIWRTPAWANGGQSAIVPPTDAADFGNFSRWAADHFRGRVAAWEIWNEPNHRGFFTGSAADYVRLLRTAYPSIKAVDPLARVVFGGPSYNDTTWLAQAYDAGARGYFDVMATHPYMGVADLPPETPDDGTPWTLAHVGAVHHLMEARGDGAKEIWFTEMGWSSHDNWPGVDNWDRGVTPAQQAEYAVRAIDFVRANFPYVTNMFWYRDRNGASGDAQLDNYGLLNRDLSTKPVYDALRSRLTAAPTTAAPAIAVVPASTEPTSTPAPLPAPSTVSVPVAAPAVTAPSAAPGPVGYAAVSTQSAPAASPAAPRRSGYWMLDESGTVHAFGDAGQFGSVPAGRAVDLEPSPGASGYWVVDESGAVAAFGDAPGLGGLSRGTLLAGESVTSLSRTPSGGGYWLFTTRGRVFAFGDAVHHGDMAGIRLNGPVLDSIPTPSGNGYYMVGSDGGIFAFGDAVFAGSMGGHKLNAPVQSLVPDGDGAGYWLVASDGGIFAFDAPFRGSMGGSALNAPITGMVRYGDGYLMVATDGGIFSFSDEPFVGSLGDSPPSRPVSAVAPVV